MTIKISGDKGLGPLDGLKKNQKAQADTDKSKAGATDKVSFSSALQQAAQTQEAKGAVRAESMEKVAFSPLILEMSHLQDGGSSEVSARQQKIAALKAQIAEGSYQPDLKQVAASLLKFVAGEK
ncbi:flagellar biosynthesis anti-sigma factor FlgM [Desulfuromonas sp. KJ2020]|uniref:flagellar biosynthesis anti-sigma factor FlgM n=1 Tax=Desulfuromonas sp. KJ2020 TaxID=2919173 RepID=UPI0020A7C47A|nr:flagellar biosynthesis anti-sigma factor FlgM [Desulfuromonas sp. KJ2020]MCP3178430.1 flagellar biosynthesis anti-sigma factor FlgM [Desulfuromonas sp. KJ2020]